MSYSVNDYSNAPQILKDFLFYLLTIKGRSKLTVDNYYTDLRTFFRYMKYYRKKVPANCPIDQIDISDIDLDFIASITLSDVYEFLHYIYDDRQNNARTRARKMSSLRGFFKYLCNTTGKLKENPITNLEMPSIPKSLPKHLTLEQCIDLLQAVDSSDPNYARDYCILTLFLNCGMRLSELTGLNLSSFANNTVTVVGKGNKERVLYLNSACESALADYLSVRSQIPKIIDQNALFINRSGKRLGQRRVEQIVTSLLDKAGLSNLGFSAHKLRHTAATMMYQYGKVDVRILQDILGHENLSTTQIYTHVSNEQKEQAISQNPLAKIKKHGKS